MNDPTHPAAHQPGYGTALKEALRGLPSSGSVTFLENLLEDLLGRVEQLEAAATSAAAKKG